MQSLLVVSKVAVVSLAFGCSAAPGNSTPSAPEYQQSATEGSPVTVAVSGAVVGIALSPLALTPSFSAAIEDYYVRCATGANALTLTVTDEKGATSTAVSLVDDQAAVVGGKYWIRCLPPDFPTITVTKSGAPTPGYYLVDSLTFGAVFDANGVPVWYERGSSMANVDSQAVNQISLMPNSSGGFGTSAASKFELHALDMGQVSVLQAYKAPTDAHELRTLPNGDHLLFTYPLESGVDLTGLQAFGVNQTIADCEIEEIDPLGNLVWSWRAAEHIDPVKESLEPAAATVNGATVVDVFHCNSIEVDESGNLLISSRHTNALFYVDRDSGVVQWKLGGSAFNKDGAALIRVQSDPETTFSMQHDARFQPNGDITLFDDHGAGSGVARGVEYAVDHRTNTATVVFQYLGTAASAYEGGFRRYADGESVIGWGSIPTDPRVVTEIDENGNDVFDLAFDGTNPTYRAVKVPLSQLDINLMRQAVGS